MTTPSDQDVASACRWLDGKLARCVFSWDTSADTLGERIIATARALGWTPSLPAPVFTEAEVIAAMSETLVEVAKAVDPYLAMHQIRTGAPGIPDLPLDLRAILNRIRGGR